MNRRLIALVLGLALPALPALAAPGPQQARMKQCNADAKAKALKGDAHKAFMKSCLRGQAAAEVKPLTPQQQRMAECNAKAGAQSLAGAARKAFMKGCLKGP